MEIKLKAEERQNLGIKLKTLREKGFIPAVLYGKGIRNMALEVGYKDFVEILGKAGSSTILDLDIKGKKHNVLIQDFATDPITDKYIHVDFYQVRMDEAIEAKVVLKFIGVSPAVKDMEGVLVKNVAEVEVKALPKDLPSEVVIDISSLKTFDDVIKIKDLKISDKVEVLEGQNEVIATVTPPRTEEELEKLNEEVTEDVEEVEGVKEEEKEGEETEEGEEGKEGEEAKEGEDKAAPEKEEKTDAKIEEKKPAK